MKISVFIICITLLSVNRLYSQCGCPGNNTDIGLTSFEEMTRQEAFYPNNFFINLFYKYSFADDYFKKDSRIDNGPIEQLKTSFSNLKLIYKPLNELTVEADLGYLIVKRQVNRSPKDIVTSSGLSDFTLSGKYAFIKIPEDNLEVSGGMGIKIPVKQLNQWVPQNIQPSTGAFAYILYAGIRKYFPEARTGMMLSHRTDFNFRDKWNYRYGNSHITSIVFLYSASEYLHLGAELRNDIRLKDYKAEQKLDESGMINFSISPLFRFTHDQLSLTTFFEYPFYQYFNGFQIANKFSVTLNLSYGLNI